MTKDELIELFDEAIGNAKCIGHLDGMWQGRGPWPEQDYRGMVALEQANSSKRKKLSDALAAADKRIAELEKYGRVQDPLADRIAELERKLDVARFALNEINIYAVDGKYDECAAEAKKALAQIGGEDASS